MVEEDDAADKDVMEEDVTDEDVVIREEVGEKPVKLLVKLLLKSPEKAAHRSTRLRKILQI